VDAQKGKTHNVKKRVFKPCHPSWRGEKKKSRIWKNGGALATLGESAREQQKKLVSFAGKGEKKKKSGRHPTKLKEGRGSQGKKRKKKGGQG